MRITEENYVDQMRRGNEQALQFFIEQHGWIVKSVIHKRMANHPQEQDDCMNDTFFAIWKNVDRYDETKAAFTTWVAAVTRYQVLNYIRSLSRETAVEDIDTIELMGQTDVESPYLHAEEEREFSELLSALPVRDREIFVKMFWEGCSHEEIARSTGIKKEVLYNRISRAKRKLRQSGRLEHNI